MSDAPPAAADRAPLPHRKVPGVFRDTTGWYLGVSAYWFATSMKWFILFLLQPIQVAQVVEGGAKNSAWGMVVALGAAEAMVGPALFGYLSDRCASRWGRRRPFLAIGAALTAIALFVLAGAKSLPLMIFGYLFLQVSDDIGTGPYAAVIPDYVPEEKRGRASGVMSMVQLAAQIAAVALALPLGNIALIYIAAAVVNVVCALIVLAVVREGRFDFSRGRGGAADALTAAPPAVREAGLAARIERGVANWFAPFRVADFRWVWFTRFLTALGFYLILTYVTNYITDRVPSLDLFGLSLGSKEGGGVKNAALVAALVISLSGAVASVWAGKAADRIGRKRVIVGAGWLMWAMIVPFAFIPNYSVVIVLAAFFGLGYGAYLSASWALAADVLPSKDDAAKDMGIWQASVATPQIISGVVGFIVDRGNHLGPGYGYTTAFLISAFAFLSGSLLVKRVKGST